MVEETEQDQVLSYRIAASGKFIIYMTASEKFYILDRALWKHAYIPTAGQLLNEGHATFEVTPDGRYLIYIAWGVHPGTEEQAPVINGNSPATTYTYGTVLSIDLNELLKPQIVVGLCEIASSTPDSSSCKTLHLSPEGSRVVFTDRHGLWMGNVATGGAQLLTEYPAQTAHDEPVSWRPLSWAADGQQLLVEVVQPEETSLAVARLAGSSGETAEAGATNPPGDETRTIMAHLLPLPETICREQAMCQMEAMWGPGGYGGPNGDWQPAGIWVNKVALAQAEADAGSNRPLEAQLFLIQFSEEGEPQIVRRKSIAGAGSAYPDTPIYATSIHPLDNGQLTFIHPDARCPQPCPDCNISSPADTLCPSALTTGIYLMASDNTLRPVALLPQPGGTMLWSPDDKAFLYLDPSSNPMWIGRFTPPTLWDVTKLLDKAGDFQWVTPYTPSAGGAGE
jgi:hypothetical protein